MRDRNAVFVGCDVGDKKSEICVLDEVGAVVDRRQLQTTSGALKKALAKHVPAVVAIEVGTHSRWIEEVLLAAGHRVIVANPRQVQLIWKRGKKTDKADALLLARLARVDVTLLAPVHHRSRTSQVDLAAIRSRDVLVQARTKLVNHVRGMLKPFGVRAPSCSTNAFPDRVVAEIPTELVPALMPVVEVLRGVNEQIAAHDRQIEQLAASCPVTTHLAEVDSIGALTALAFRLTVEDPAKFKKSRVVPAFLGLTPAKDQSGHADPQKRISRAGDPLLRRLLVQCAQNLLGHGGRDCDIRRWGLRIAERGGGKNAKKRAIVAVARKLAVVLHRIWVSGEAYHSFHPNAVTAS
jgi:transposase